MARQPGKQRRLPPGQSTLDRIPAKYLEPIVRKAIAQQQARFLNERDSAGAQEIFKSADKLDHFRRLVLTGKPVKPLVALYPRPVNPTVRDRAVKAYLDWMANREHPRFKKEIGFAVTEVNRYRKRIGDVDDRTLFDYSLRKEIERMGLHEKQFDVHFPEVHPQGKVFPPVLQERDNAGKTRNPQSKRRNAINIPRIFKGI